MSARAAVAGPVFLARTGLRAAGREALIAALAVAITAFLVAVAPLSFGRTADDVLRARLEAATEAQRGLEFELRGRLDPGTDEPLAAVTEQATALAAELPPSLGAAAGEPEATVDTVELLALGAPRPILRLTLRMQDVANGVRWVDGRPPGPTTRAIELDDRPAADGGAAPAIVYEAALSTATAATTGLAVGDRVLTVPGTNLPGFVAVDVVGIFDVVDPAADRWYADPTLARTIDERISSEVTEYHAVALVDPGTYPTLHGTSGERGAIRLPFRYRWRLRLDPDHLVGRDPGTLEADLARLRAAHPFGGGGAAPNLSTGLADLVEGYRLDRAAAASTVAVALVGPLAAMLAMLAVVAVADQRRRTAALVAVRSRGGGTAQAVTGRTLEAAVVLLPAALAGGALAGILVAGDAAAGLGPALAVGLAAVAFAFLAAVAASRRPTVGRMASPGGRAGGRRLVFDLLVVAIALGAAASLVGHDGSGGGDLDVGLAAAVPALLALAGGMVLLHLYPAVVGLAARFAAGRRGLVAVHALRGVERGAAGHEIPLLALVLAIATGTFAALTVGTLAAATERVAALAIGADLRVEERNGDPLPPALDLAAVPGVEAIATASLGDGRLGSDGPLTLPVTVVVLDVPAWQAVVAALPLGRDVPREMAEPPPTDVGSPGRPVAALVDGSTLARLGLGPGAEGRLAVGSATIPVRAAGPADAVPGPWSGDAFVVIDRAAAAVALPDFARGPAMTWIRAPAAAEAAVADEVARYAPAVVLASRHAMLRDLEAAPLVVAARAAFGAAIAIALLNAVLVVAFAAREAALARRRELAVLAALGLPAPGVTRLLAVEVVPLVATALAAGLALGALVAAVVVPGLGLGRLLGDGGATPLAGDPGLLVAFAAAPLVGAGAALAAGAVAARRADLAVATRAVEP